MSLLPSTQSIVECLEALSQRPVHIIETAALETMADIKIARGNQPFHLLRYRPTSSTPPDYLIAYQCGLTLRVFELPPEMPRIGSWTCHPLNTCFASSRQLTKMIRMEQQRPAHGG